MWGKYQRYADSMHGMMLRADDVGVGQNDNLWAPYGAYAAGAHGMIQRADDVSVPHTPIENFAMRKQGVVDTLHPTIRDSQILDLSGPRRRSGSMMRSVRSVGYPGNTLADVQVGSTTIPTWAVVVGGLGVGGLAAWLLLRKK